MCYDVVLTKILYFWMVYRCIMPITFWFFSVFNAEAIKDVTLIKGGFPARYGGRLSSVLEINLKDGHQQEFHGDVSIGIVGFKLTLEGPLNKGKTSFLVSGRANIYRFVSETFHSGRVLKIQDQKAIQGTTFMI